MAKCTFQTYLLLCFCLCFTRFASAQNEENYVVDFITVKDGLSHNYVTSLVSDHLNLKWIGTENGITKYNGYDFENIKPNAAFPGLLNENIEVLFIDKDSNLWIGTKSGGLSFLNTKTNYTKSYNSLIDFARQGAIRVTSITQDADGNIWIGTWKNGVFLINPKEDKLVKHFNYNEPVNSLKLDFNNNIWFCSGVNLLRYNIKDNDLKLFRFNQQVNDILPDESRLRIWISTTGNTEKLYYFDQYTKSIKDIDTKGVKSNFSKRLLLDQQNRIWIGTWGNGLYRSSKDLSVFSKVNLLADSQNRISGNYSTILSIHQDKNKVVWVTTASGGVVELTETTGFQNINDVLKNEELKNALNCTSIHKSENTYFLGTLFSGVYFGDSLSSLKKLNGISNEKINSFYQHNDTLFIGSAKGFYGYNISKNQMIFKSNDIKKVTAFYIDGDEIFIGTQQDGVIVTRLKNIEDPSSYQHYSEDLDDLQKMESDRITSIKSDNYNNIWVSTYNGLHLFNKNTRSFIHQAELLDKPIPANIINGFEINKDFMWLATPNGLIKLKINGAALEFEKVISKTNGLNSDFICAITFDAFNNIWFSTQTEIISYNEDKASFINYGEINGIKTSLFNNNAYFNFDNQAIFFGGIDNLIFFNPQDVKPFLTPPEVVFTHLSIKNNSVLYDANNKKNYLDQSINYAQRVELKHTDDFFSTRFVANDFLGQSNINYRYKINEDDKEWINLYTRNELNFTGLNPGEYKLQVQASRDNQNWSPSKSLIINLKSSPWKTPLAYLIYSTIVIGVIIFLIRLNNRRLKLQNSLEIAKIEQEKKVELANSKLNFFTNISHEFRTPLTLMISPVKELIEFENLPQKAYNKLNYIEKNTSRLLKLVNELLDFRKSEYGILKITASYGDFSKFAYEVFLYFKESAHAKSIDYNFVVEREPKSFPFDRNKMEIVLCNLMSNAIKFTNKGGHINLKINSVDNQCIIIIEDNGIGMASGDAERVFDKFYQIKSSNSAKMVGSGIGLTFSKKIIELHHGSISLKSKKGIGTKFVVKISTRASDYKGEINEAFKKTDNIEAYETLEAKTPKSLELKSSKPEILIVDDNADILNYLSDILSSNYKVQKATNGAEGIEEAINNCPDIIVSDVMMPIKDGISLCKELKNNINTSHIPIILLTARTSTVFEIDGLKHGADDYITKPFNADVILARIASQLENREKTKAHYLNKVRFEPNYEDVEVHEGTEDKFIRDTIALVEQNLQNPAFGIETMMSELGMSRSSLFRKIKSLTGLSLSAFIRSVRVKKAAQIILTEDLSLKEIAYEVGFNTYKYFKLSFQQQFNCLPSKYKEQLKNNQLQD